MKNTVKLFGIIALIALLVFAACDNGTDPDTEDITWTLDQVGGAATADTTAILIKFNGAVNLTDADVTIGGAATRDTDQALSSSGNVWTVPVTVSTTDNATVTVTKAGVEGGQKTVLVYKAGVEEPITWTAVADGTEDTQDSTKITFTFSAAVTLDQSDITLTPGTGSVICLDDSLTGSGTEWDLTISVNTQGTISVKITKDGISATAQDVTVYKEATHPVSGKISWIKGSQVVFSDDTGTNGTYTLNSYNWDTEEWDSVAGEGTWTWNQSAAAVTLTATKVLDDFATYSYELLTKSEMEEACLEAVQLEVEQGLEYYMDEDWGLGLSQEDAEAQFLEDENGYRGTNYTTLDEYIEGETAKKLAGLFDPLPYTYIFENGGETLILLEALPTPVGTDELAGKTFYIAIPDWQGGNEADEDQPFVFSAGGTFTATINMAWTGADITFTGTYSYDSTTKRVYLKPATIDDKTPAQYFADVEPDEYSNYPTEDDYRAATTNQYFKLMIYIYDTEENILLSGGGISGFNAMRDSVR